MTRPGIKPRSPWPLVNTNHYANVRLHILAYISLKKKRLSGDIAAQTYLVTPILSHGVYCNTISGQGVHVTPYPNPTGPVSSTRLVVGPVWFNIKG